LCDRFFGIYTFEKNPEKSSSVLQISSVGLSLTEIEATVHGYGNHLDSLTKAQIHEALEVSHAINLLGGCGTC
jgi:hypothetical protein